MGLLDEAMPRNAAADSEIKIKSPNGVYRAFWLGMATSYEWVSPYKEQCRLCKGSKRGYNGEGDCQACHGSGKRTEMRTKLIYKLENGETEEEEVNFKLMPSGTTQDGKILSPTTLFLRLRAFSGNRQATPADLNQWFSALPSPIRIPVQVVINDNKSGTASKIVDVSLRPNGAAKPAQQPAPQPEKAPEPVHTDYEFNNDDLPF